jgi:hypothetical protein
MEVKMISPVTSRKATTPGHEATYDSPWSTGDLREGTKVAIQLCAVAGTSSYCGLASTGHASSPVDGPHPRRVPPAAP